jgi:hypothetical protein
LRANSTHALSPGTALVTISCGSTTSCVALDALGRAYSFDGTEWSGPVPASAQALGEGALSVSCASPSLCMAVATARNQITDWDGHAWSPPVTVGGANDLEAVGCAPTGYCASVDSEGNAFAFDGQAWRGTSGAWGSVSSISCVSASFCISVSGGISEWNGDQWTTPDPYTSTSSFSGVSCPSASFCTAVDQAGEAFQWNGQAWSASVRVEPGPASTTSSGVALTGVSCPTATFCAAVDGSGGLLQWSDGTWTRSQIDGTRTLDAIACPSATLCLVADAAGNVITVQP